jgi:type IV pilus assembly protein PilA
MEILKIYNGLRSDLWAREKGWILNRKQFIFLQNKRRKCIMKKMNNKGFSLVELIVVVLIMAIIAVALAPQVMKWVENSRVSTDATNYESMVENLQLALADKDVYKKISGSEETINVYINKYGTNFTGKTAAAGTADTSATITNTSNTTAIVWGLSKIDSSWPKIAKKASAEPTTGEDYYQITITTGKQANVAKVAAQCPDKLKDGTDLS